VIARLQTVLESASLWHGDAEECDESGEGVDGEEGQAEVAEEL
jgi:hypothetical protein